MSCFNQGLHSNAKPFASCGCLGELGDQSFPPRKNELHQNWSLLDAVEREKSASKPFRLPMVSFNHIAREVRSLEKSKRFYVDILGFSVIPRPPFDSEGYWLHGYNLNLHLVSTTVPEERKQIKTARIQHFSSALPRVDHTAFLSDDLSVIKDILDRENVYYKYETLPSSGISQIFFFDPDGNVIEVSNCAPRVGEVRCDVGSPPAAYSNATGKQNDDLLS